MKDRYLYDYAQCKRCKQQFDKHIELPEMHSHLMTHKDLELVTVAGAGSYFRFKNHNSFDIRDEDTRDLILIIIIIGSILGGVGIYNILVIYPALELKENNFKQGVINDDCIGIHNMMQSEYNRGHSSNPDSYDYSPHLEFESNQYYIKGCK